VGYGAFGQVYKGCKKGTGEYVAIKCERMEGQTALLIKEAAIMRHLERETGCPSLHWAGESKESDGHTYYFIVMDFLGMNLTELLNREVERKFSPRTVLHLTTQFIRQLELVHA